jgi:hypothetical protein
MKEEETDPRIVQAWRGRCDEFYVALLSKISAALGYHFTDEELRRGVYYPQGHSERENAHLAILHGLRLILEGKESLQMRLTAAPGATETADLQRKLTERMVDAYDPDGSLKVRIRND